MEDSGFGDRASIKIAKRVPGAVIVSADYQYDGESRKGHFAVFYPGADKVHVEGVMRSPEFWESYKAWREDGRFTPQRVRYTLPKARGVA